MAIARAPELNSGSKRHGWSAAGQRILTMRRTVLSFVSGGGSQAGSHDLFRGSPGGSRESRKFQLHLLLTMAGRGVKGRAVVFGDRLGSPLYVALTDAAQVDIIRGGGPALRCLCDAFPNSGVSVRSGPMRSLWFVLSAALLLIGLGFWFGSGVGRPFFEGVMHAEQPAEGESSRLDHRETSVAPLPAELAVKTPSHPIVSSNSPARGVSPKELVPAARSLSRAPDSPERSATTDPDSLSEREDGEQIDKVERSDEEGGGLRARAQAAHVLSAARGHLGSRSEGGWGVASHARSFERPLGHQAARRIE